MPDTPFPVPAQVQTVGKMVGDVTSTAIEVIEDERGLMQATNQLATIAATRKNSEAARKALVKPLNDHVKFINDQFKVSLEPLAVAERDIKSAVVGYHERQEAAAQAAAEAVAEAQRKAEEEAGAQRQRDNFLAGLEGREPDPEPEVVVPAAPPVPEVVTPTVMHTAAGSTSFTKRWTFDVTDFKALCAAIAAGEVDETFADVVGKTIRAAITDKDNPLRECPGLRIYQAGGVTVRG